MIKQKPKKVFLLGMGISGLSLAKYLTKNKVENFCWDDDPEKRKIAESKKLNITRISIKTLKICDLLVLSPGINHLAKEPHKAVSIARDLKIKIITDLEFLNIFLSGKLLIGITGTNGKSTTTHFINKTLSYNNFRKSESCGNIGIPFTDLKINEETILVVEASSYQLAKIDSLKFNFAFLLNISKDHIEWHGSIKKYINSKLKIFKNQDRKCFAIICIDDQHCKNIASSFGKNFNSKLLRISCKQDESADILLSKKKEKLEIHNKISNETLSIPYYKLNFTKADHNYQNLLAAYVSGYLLNQPADKFLKSLKDLDNLRYRIEFLGKFKNLSFYNDSKSTNVDSAITAIRSFKNIFWILGGREKKGGIRGIEKSLDNVIKAYSFGESGKKIKKFLTKRSIDCYEFSTLQESTKKALNDAIKSDKDINILLSPACSSFDQFKDFRDRGQKFTQIVKEYIKTYEQK